MRILFVFNGRYPEGMAMSNRLHLYCKGLIAEGIDPEVMVPSSGEIFTNHLFDGIKYSSFRNPVIFKNYFLRQINSTFASFIYARNCFKYSKSHDLLFLIGYGWFATSLMIFGAHLGGARTVLEINENPYSPEAGRLDAIWIRKVRRYLMLNIPFRISDGFIAISDKLVELINKYKNKTAKTIKIPILVDKIVEFNVNYKKTNIPFVFHAGAQSETKDGSSAVFEAFVKACRQLKGNLHFVLTQNIMHPDLSKKINELIMSNRLETKVTFLGYVSKLNLIELRNSCSLAIVNKPPNWQNDFNFPTKLGEYLASGIPTIVSSTGEMSKYLRDNETAFIVAPNDVNAITTKIVFIIEHPQIAKKIGQAGRELANKEFFYMKHAGSLAVFLNSMEK
jgi:glycosyltransferase involved in cell wall biosynthesis